MYANGFVKVSACSPKVRSGDPKFNVNEILKNLEELENNAKVDFAVFPELSICGYSIGDLVFQESLYNDSLKAFHYLLDKNPFEGIVIVGSYLFVNDVIYNCAFVIQKNKILGIIPKTFSARSYEFYETRWFVSGDEANFNEVSFLGETIPFGSLIFSNEDAQIKFGVEICEDYWSILSPHEKLYASGAIMVFNLSASPEEIGKGEKRLYLAKAASYKGTGAYIYTSTNTSETTSDVIYSNHKIIVENGVVLNNYNDINLDGDYIVDDIDISKLHYLRRKKSWVKNVEGYFSKLREISYSLVEEGKFSFVKKMDLFPFVPKNKEDFARIIDLQAASVKKRLDYIGIEKVVIGVSGGLDSTLALLSLTWMVDKFQMKRSDILAVSLPSENTKNSTYENSHALIDRLGLKKKEIAIDDDIIMQSRAIGLDINRKDITYENIQARFRTYTLMNLANLHEAIVIGTTDLSEVALGWSTFNGDHMAMYGINAGLTKTVVKATLAYFKEVYPEVSDIIDKVLNEPISPELSNKDQKTEDIIGKYQINDFILYHFWVNGDSKDRIAFLLEEFFNLSPSDSKKYINNFFKRFYSQQYKRLTMPEAAKILEITLSPRTEVKLISDIYDSQK